MDECEFIYDNNAIIRYNSVYYDLKKRIESEKIFRQIITHCITTNIIDKSKNIIDLGAWVGDNALPWASNIEGIIYAIDPSVDNCNFIDECSNFNSITNIYTICNAISDKEEILSTNDSLNHCSFMYNENCSEISNSTNKLNKVLSTTLDVLYTNKVIDNIGFIHLDVEGMEYNVIKGAKKLIETCRPILSYEQHLELDIHIEDIKDYLKEIKYIVKIIDEELQGCRSDCRNFLAIPEEIYATILPHKIFSYLLDC